MKVSKAFFVPFRHSRVGGNRNGKPLHCIRILNWLVQILIGKLNKTNYESHISLSNFRYASLIFIYFNIFVHHTKLYTDETNITCSFS